MSGQIKVNQVQLGDSATATQNFVLQTNVDGTAKLARGNVGATSQDIFTIDTGGGLNVPAATLSGHVVNLGLADARYAALLGNTANKFSVAAGVAATDAVNVGQLPFKTFFISTAQTITLSSVMQVAHGLGSTPKLFSVKIRCLTAELGYSVGDDAVPLSNTGSSVFGTGLFANSTNLGWAVSANIYVVDRASLGTTAYITPANWALYFEAII